MSIRKRVLLAGLFHETHTFLDGVTPRADFAVRRGDALLAARGDGSPLAGVVEFGEPAGWEFLPSIDLRATPSATAEDAVVEAFWDGFLATYERESPRGIDGISLVLHGAMVSASFHDVEGEIIARIRRLPGAAAIPICGVLDLHGNISRACAEQTQGLVAYRCCPHTDAHEAAVSGARLLDRILTTGTQPRTVWASPRVMWPPTGTATDGDPMRTLAARARRIERDYPEIACVNVMAGFSFADTPMTGVSFSATTFGDPGVACAKLNDLCAWTVANRELGAAPDLELAGVLPQVKQHVARGETPVLLVEPSDNIGGGAPGDGTTILRVLLEHQIDSAAVIINDPAAVAALQSSAIGDSRRLSIGGRGSRLADGPVDLDVELVSRSDGRFELADRQSHLASMGGVHVEMGPCAVVRHGGVRILLTSKKTPPFDLGQWLSQGIDPAKLSVIGVKAAVAHRRAYDPIAKASYTVDTPGPCRSNLKLLPFEHVERPIWPLDG